MQSLVEIAIALIPSIGIVGVALINRKLNAIHVLVNQRMTDALNEIKALRIYVDQTAKPGDPAIPPKLTAPTTPDV